MAQITIKVENQLIGLKVPDGLKPVVSDNGGDITIHFEKEGPKHERCTTWEQYCMSHALLKDEQCYIDANSIIKPVAPNHKRSERDDNVMNNKEECEAILALQKLYLLHEDWLQTEDFPDKQVNQAAIVFDNTTNDFICICEPRVRHRMLSFPNGNMASDFLKCFKDLLHTAKIFL